MKDTPKEMWWASLWLFISFNVAITITFIVKLIYTSDNWWILTLYLCLLSSLLSYLYFNSHIDTLYFKHRNPS